MPPSKLLCEPLHAQISDVSKIGELAFWSRLSKQWQCAKGSDAFSPSRLGNKLGKFAGKKAKAGGSVRLGSNCKFAREGSHAGEPGNRHGAQ